VFNKSQLLLRLAPFSTDCKTVVRLVKDPDKSVAEATRQPERQVIDPPYN